METKDLEGMLFGGIWLRGATAGMRLMGLTVKVEPTGLLMILKVVTAEGPKVAFRQVKSLAAMYQELAHWDDIPQEKWREDRFALDRSGT